MSDHQEDSRGYSRELLESESEKKIVAKHKSSEFLPNMYVAYFTMVWQKYGKVVKNE